ncbi:TPA: chorismate synthase [bacterium]|nr:chorismate synthase [bacterium]
MFRFLTAGESHGKCLTVIIEGLPANLGLDVGTINEDLKRRQGGYGRGDRMRIEEDRVEITSGMRGGHTLGSPLCMTIYNRDWKDWKEIMAVGPEALLSERPVISPRPGHADLSGAIKYGFRDIRDVLERSSARETAARVAVGSVAKIFLNEFMIKVITYVIQIGGIKSQKKLSNFSEIREKINQSRLYCLDEETEERMIELIDKTDEEGDSLGGVFEVVAFNLPVGLGSYVHWDRRLDGRLAQALMSIPAIKGVEIGLGFETARLPGSLVHDEIFFGEEQGFYRKTNRAGGLEGGVTNGQPLILRAVMKPIPTLKKSLASINFGTKEPTLATYERSDVCAVPAAAVVGEAVVAIELAKAFMEKFGGDTIEEIRKSYETYLKEFD